MKYKSYLKSSDTPSRNVRKASRRGVFLFNKAAKKAQLKARRLERKSSEI